MKHILITGGAGFIGANFVPYFAKKYPDYHIVNIDALTYAGNIDNLAEMNGVKNYTFVKGDIRNEKLIAELFTNYDIRGVLHFAAESHVDNSINVPDVFVTTNVNGTFNLLNTAKRLWINAPFKPKPGYEDCRFHHISTDEVYGSLGETGFFSEETPYAPNSPYSASKAGSDFLVRSFVHTYGLNATISNCSNNYGPKQHSEKLMPTIIRKALAGEPIPIYGNGKNVRDWLYVLDHCKAIDLVFHEGLKGETYCVGGKNERNNIEIANAICKILDELKPLGSSKKYAEQISFVTDRAGHDFRYAIDAGKIETKLGWRAEETFDTGIVETVKWYLRVKA